METYPARSARDQSHTPLQQLVRSETYHPNVKLPGRILLRMNLIIPFTLRLNDIFPYFYPAY